MTKTEKHGKKDMESGNEWNSRQHDNISKPHSFFVHQFSHFFTHLIMPSWVMRRLLTHGSSFSCQLSPSHPTQRQTNQLIIMSLRMVSLSKLLFACFLAHNISIIITLLQKVLASIVIEHTWDAAKKQS